MRWRMRNTPARRSGDVGMAASVEIAPLGRAAVPLRDTFDKKM
jgi:hypothetical protein